MCVFTQNVYLGKLIASVAICGKGACKAVIKVKYGHNVDPWSNMMNFFVRLNFRKIFLCYLQVLGNDHGNLERSWLSTVRNRIFSKQN